MRCPTCGFDNPEGFRFCGSCGSGLAQACPSCGADVPPGFRFCGVCGAALDEGLGAGEPAGTRGMPSERRPVTVLFADLVGFSTLADLTAGVEAREGTVEKFIGDAVVAIFGVPAAHEDDPHRAVETALEMLEVVRRRSGSTASPLSLRIGVN